MGKQKMKKVECPAHLYPPDGKGIWLIAKQDKAQNKSSNRGALKRNAQDEQEESFTCN